MPPSKPNSQPLFTPTTSFWFETADRKSYPAAHDLSVDVAIVGGGIVGLTTALALKRAGARVAVLQDRRIGEGVTGYTTGKLSSLHGLKYAQLLASQGKERAQAYADANEQGLATTAQLVDELKIDCDFERRVNHTYSCDPSDSSKLEDEVEAARTLNLPADFVTDLDLPFAIPGGAVRFADQAQFHSCRYLQALAKAVEGDGSHVFENSRVTGVHDRSPLTVELESGTTVTAQQAVIATHYPILDRGLFFARLTCQRSYALAVRVKGELPAGMYLSSDSGPTRSIRPYKEGSDVLIVGGAGHKTGEADPREQYAEVERFAREHFDVREVIAHWSAHDNMPPDDLPYIGKLSPFSGRLFTATGFMKWGLAFSASAAEMLCDEINGKAPKWGKIFTPNRIRPRVALPKLLKENAHNGAHFVGDRLTKRASTDSLSPGEGKVVSDGATQRAVFRDDDGKLHQLSARCTHLGCIVAFNAAERTWDCPCHGSRFDTDGRIIQGPAKKDLPKQ